MNDSKKALAEAKNSFKHYFRSWTMTRNMYYLLGAMCFLYGLLSIIGFLMIISNEEANTITLLDWIWLALSFVVGFVAVQRGKGISEGIQRPLRTLDHIILAASWFFGAITLIMLYRYLCGMIINALAEEHGSTYFYSDNYYWTNYFSNIVWYILLHLIAVYAMFQGGIGAIIGVSLAVFSSSLSWSDYATRYSDYITLEIYLIMQFVRYAVSIFTYVSIPYFLSHNKVKKLVFSLLLSSALCAMLYNIPNNLVFYVFFPGLYNENLILAFIAGTPLTLIELMLVSIFFTILCWRLKKKYFNQEEDKDEFKLKQEKVL